MVKQCQTCGRFLDDVSGQGWGGDPSCSGPMLPVKTETKEAKEA